ncbi:MAG: AraC family transcriptional regulator [Bacteroidota bacterium]
MKILFQHLESSEDETFLTYHLKKKYYDVPLHYHPEIEIMYVIKGQGMRIVGNSIQNFKENDLVIVGSGVSHVWKSDKSYHLDNDLETEYIVLFINEELVNKSLYTLPEFISIRNMLLNSDKGISFDKEKSKKLKDSFIEIAQSTGINKLHKTTKLLSKLSEIKEIKYLSERNLAENDNNNDSDRLNKCIDYITDNFQNKIELKKVADLASLTPNSFCRYFKIRTTKTFSQYVSELRTSKACNLLIETDSTIENIAFECGFNTMPNFYKQFKNKFHILPKEYREKYRVE